MSTLVRVRQNFSKVLSAEVVATGLNFLALSINTRALGLESFGVFLVIQAISELATQFGSFQTWQGMIRFGADDLAAGSPRRLRARFRFGLLMDTVAASTATVLAVVALLFWSAAVGLPGEYRMLGIIYALSGLVSGTGSSTGILRLTDRFGLAMAIQVTASAALVVNAFILAATEQPLATYVYTVAGISALTSVALIAAGWLRVERLNRDRPDDADHDAKVNRKQFFRFSMATSASGTLNTVRRKSELLIVSAIAGPGAAALFGIAFRVANLLSRFAEAGRLSVYPELAKLVASGDFGEAKAVAAKVSKLGMFVAVPVYAMTLAFGDVGLSFGFGEEYAVAHLNLIWLMTASLLYACSFALGPLVLIAYGPRRFLAINATASVSFVAAAVTGPLVIGPAGAGLGAAAFSCIYVAMLACHAFLLDPPAPATNADRAPSRRVIGDPPVEVQETV